MTDAGHSHFWLGPGFLVFLNHARDEDGNSHVGRVGSNR
jgi:hypothetical protein